MISREVESLRGQKSGCRCGGIHAHGSDFIVEILVLSDAGAGGQLLWTGGPVETDHKRIHAMCMLWDLHRSEYGNRANPSTGGQDRQGIIQVILRASSFGPARVYQK
jgi:hypothetical protein